MNVLVILLHMSYCRNQPNWDPQNQNVLQNVSIKLVALCCRSIFEVTFQMPPGIKGSETQIRIGFARWETVTEWYTYLANPEVTRVAANSSIERSVQEMQLATMALWEVCHRSL